LVAHEAIITNVSDSQKQIVGVVDVTVLRDKNVMDHLPPQAEEYLYISGIAVLKAFRLKDFHSTPISLIVRFYNHSIR
jgi:hypothetical protein